MSIWNDIHETFYRVQLSANYIWLKCKNEGVYQYALSFAPQVDSIGMRKRLLYSRTDVIGEVHAFDGAILFLPIKLKKQVRKCIHLFYIVY